LKGSVSIILREDDEREIVVAYLNPGDFLGKWVFESNPQRTAEVRTRDVCEIAEISYDNFHELKQTIS
jgi:CRP/FNR family cyclic AMP-dependent transcriptional regulator